MSSFLKNLYIPFNIGETEEIVKPNTGNADRKKRRRKKSKKGLTLLKNLL